MEHCKAYIKGELHSNCIINCQVYCDGAVYVTTGRGVILGGNTYSAQEVAANVVGARTEVRTVIALGGQPCEDCERREVLREIQEMERDLERTERQPNSPAREKRLSDLRLKTAIDRMKLEQFKQKLAQRQFLHCKIAHVRTPKKQIGRHEKQTGIIPNEVPGPQGFRHESFGGCRASHGRLWCRKTLMGGAPAASSRFSGGRTEIGRNASFFGHNGSAT